MARSILHRLLVACIFLTVTTAPGIAAERGVSVTGPQGPPQNAWGRYHALIIGIDTYQQWPGLKTAVKDATELRDVLVSRYGFQPENVTLLINEAASRRQIIAALRRIAAGIGPADNLFFYFAGHGQLDELTGDGFWIPSEGDAKEPGTWLSNSEIKSILTSQHLKAKNVVVIADSCYSGSMLRGGPSLLTLDGDYTAKLRTVAAKPSRQVISSGGLEPVADGGADGHSLFAFYFIKALKENDREVIDLENLFHTRVWKPVTEIGGQRPTVGRLKTPMDEDGQFVLYHQAWVAEQLRQAEEKRQQEAVAKQRAEDQKKLDVAARRRAEEDDRMAALQAERQRIEIERQKLEMEKDLLAQKRQLEMEKLSLEKQKQELEFQKMAERLAALKQQSQAAPAGSAPETVAALSPTTSPTPAAASQTGGKIRVALLPFYATLKDRKGAQNTGRLETPCVRGLQNALRSAPDFNLAVVDTDYRELPGDTRIAGDVLDKAAKERLWQKESLFAEVEPVVDEAVTLGRALGVDAALLVRIDYGQTDSAIQVNLIDVKSKAMSTLNGKMGYDNATKNSQKYFTKVFDDYRLASAKGNESPTPTAAARPVPAASVTTPRTLKTALFPYYIANALNMTLTHRQNMAGWDEGCIRGLMKALNADRGIKLAFSFKQNKWIPPDTLIVDDVLNAETAKLIWKKQTAFDTLPAPQSDKISAYGKQIGADLVIVFRGYIADRSSFEVFLLDPNSGLIISQEMTSQDNYPVKAAEQATKAALAKYWSTR